MIIIGIILLVVVPPEKLPEVMRTIGSFLNDIRRQTSGVWDDIKKDAAFKPEDIIKPADFTIKSLLESKTDKPNVINPEIKAEIKAEEKSNDDKPKQS